MVSIVSLVSAVLLRNTKYMSVTASFMYVLYIYTVPWDPKKAYVDINTLTHTEKHEHCSSIR